MNPDEYNSLQIGQIIRIDMSGNPASKEPKKYKAGIIEKIPLYKRQNSNPYKFKYKIIDEYERKRGLWPINAIMNRIEKE